MKRIISLLTVLSIVFACIPVIVYADTVSVNSLPRYTVLVLDSSNEANFRNAGKVIYTADTSIDAVKDASERFLSSVAKSSDKNYVSVITYRSQAYLLSDFTSDIDLLSQKIRAIEPQDNMRDISSGLEMAESVLENAPVNAIKSVILVSTGITNNGKYDYSGLYNQDTIASECYRFDTSVHLYAYANSAITAAQSLKDDGVYVYSIGLFKSMENIPQQGRKLASFFQMTAADIADFEDHFYSVSDVEGLDLAFSEIAGLISNRLKKITFNFQSGEDYPLTCYYTSDYFSNSSYEYNSSLSTMSLSYAMSAFGSEIGDQVDYTQKSQNAEKLLHDIGVKKENIAANDWFYKKPTTDSIAAIAGNMPIYVNGEKYTLIALAVRGGGYEQEWASNFTIGASGQHEGFAQAKNEVLTFLKGYISQQNIEGKVKLWLTGYSRAAATANLLAGAIDDGEMLSSKISYTLDDVFAYCFETPAGALTEQVKGQSKYKNIFNIVNSSDPVPYVAPSAMGFCRYGIDLYLPSPEADPETYELLKEKMLKVYYSLYSTSTYRVDDFQMKKLGVSNWLPGGEPISYIQDDTDNNFSQGLFLSNYATILSNEFIKDRNNYVASYQTQIRDICAVFFGCTDAQSKIMIDSVMASAQSEWGSLAWSYVWNGGLNPWGDKSDAFQVVSDWLIKALDDAGVTDYDKEAVDAAGKKLASLMLDLVVQHPNYFTTAVMNVDSLAGAHFPELCYSWLVVLDDNYGSTVENGMNDGNFSVVRVNCDVDVTVYDKNGNTVASIINDQPQYIEDSSYIYGLDDNGQKFVVLPDNSDYEIKITCRTDDSVNYGVNEYNAAEGMYVRNTNYFDVMMSEGESMTARISGTERTLEDSENKTIGSDSDLKGAENASEMYSVSAMSDDSSCGTVSGNGMHFYGSFAKVSALAKDGYVFDGWYADGQCVSKEETYRFCVMSDTALTARFVQNAENSFTENPDTSDNTVSYILIGFIAFSAIVVSFHKKRIRL